MPLIPRSGILLLSLVLTVVFHLKSCSGLSTASVKINLDSNKISIRLKSGELLIGNRKVIESLNQDNQVIDTRIVYEFLGNKFL